MREAGLVAVLLVVLVAADHPVVGLEGLLAAGEVLPKIIKKIYWDISITSVMVAKWSRE